MPLQAIFLRQCMGIRQSWTPPACTFLEDTAPKYCPAKRTREAEEENIPKMMIKAMKATLAGKIKGAAVAKSPPRFIIWIFETSSSLRCQGPREEIWSGTGSSCLRKIRLRLRAHWAVIAASNSRVQCTCSEETAEARTRTAYTSSISSKKSGPS